MRRPAKLVIVVERLAETELAKRGVFGWEIWEKEPSRFDYFYDAQEQCYFLEGDVTVTPENGEPVAIQKGDFVTFPKGLSCVWEIRQAVKKHYRFGE